MTGPVRIIGAGLSGLAAGVALAERGMTVEISEAAAQAGGRCRSYFDPQLQMTIDNGNHLVLSGNRAVMDFVGMIGASSGLAGLDEPAIAFVELPGRRRWTIRPNRGVVPWWTLSNGRRVPGTSFADYLQLARLLRPKTGRTVGATIAPSGVLWDRLIGPFLLAALNTPPADGDANLAARLVRETFARGGDAFRPRIANPSLSAAFIDPARRYIEARGGSIRLGRRLREIEFNEDRVSRLVFSEGAETVDPKTPVILAVPPWTAQELVPGLAAPDRFHAIVNAHFRIASPPGAEPMIGVVGGLVEWIFAFPDRISVTISAADRLLDEDREALAARIWADVAAVHGLDATLPPWQIVKEKRATFAATPDQAVKRPPARTRWRNLFLAGDWTDTGLPATIEGAIRSGFKAAELAMAR